MTTLDVAQLYRECWDTIVAYLRRRGCDPHLAEDLAQDVFVRALRCAESYDDQGKPDAWLHTIARNLLLDHHKSAAVRYAGRYEPLETDRPMFAAAPVDPGEFLAGVAGRAELAATVREACADLNPQHQQVVELRFRHGLSVDATAETIESNRNAVKSMASRAYQKLARDERLRALRTQVVTV